MRTVKIENKTALRCVQNADIYLDGAEVAEADRLPGVESFKDTNKVRSHAASTQPCALLPPLQSLVLICWLRRLLLVAMDSVVLDANTWKGVRNHPQRPCLP